MVSLEIFGQPLGGGQTLGRVGLGEDEGQALVGDPGQLLGQVILYVSTLVQLMKSSS